MSTKPRFTAILAQLAQEHGWEVTTTTSGDTYLVTEHRFVKADVEVGITYDGLERPRKISAAGYEASKGGLKALAQSILLSA